MQSVHGTGEPGLDAIKVTNWNLANKVAVSYTHLTLPTNREV